MHRVLGVLIVAVLIAHGVALDAHLRQPQEPAPKTYEEQLAELGRTLDGRFAALEQRVERVERVERAEVAQQRHARALQEHLREHTSPAPPVEPGPQPEPPRPVPGPQPPPDVIGWPPIEDVEVWADVRGPPPAQRVRFPARAARWTEERGWRWSREYAELGDLAVNVWREQWAGWDATRVTVWITNGFAGTGTVHLEGLRVSVAGVALLERAERDVILPRGTMPFRWVLGRGEADVRAWRHVSPAGPTMPWMPELALRGLGGMQTKQLGTYRVGDPGVGGGGALDGSHGGWKLAPYWGGRVGWQTTCREGLAWMEQEWLAQVGRCPIATLERGTGRWANPHVPYWQGRTPDHELPGFTFVASPDAWCAYESQLRYLRPHDHTHYARAFTAAAAVALHDAPARTWLAWCWGDVTLALDGAPSPLNLLQHLPQWFARPAGTGDSRAGRGFAHQLRCFLESEPWLPPDLLVTSWGETWREALRRAVQHVAMPNGVTFAAAQAAWPDAITGVQLFDPIAASRELDLMGANYLGLGLRDLDAAWRRFMVPVQTTAGWQSVGDRLEVRPGARHWTALAHYKPNAQPEYDLFRARDVEGPELARHGGLDAVLAKARNESPSEPLVANLPTALWQRTLR